jgi:hypothetical protein
MEFEQYIQPYGKYDPKKHTTHSHLLLLMDQRIKSIMLENCDEYDIIRLNAISANGSMSWINLPYNYKWSVEFPNRVFYILKSLILGNKLFNNDNNKCKKCDAIMDLYGYHALSCPNGNERIKRHDKICDFLFSFISKKWQGAKQEQRYMEIISENGILTIIMNNDRPGDIYIPNWIYSSIRMGPIYLDVTIGNNFAKSNIDDALKGIGNLSNTLEKKKDGRYKKTDVLGLGLEIFGAQSSSLKIVLHQIAQRLATTSTSLVSETEWLHRIRSKMIGHLMYDNAMMIIACMRDVSETEIQTYMVNVLEIVNDI